MVGHRGCDTAVRRHRPAKNYFRRHQNIRSRLVRLG